MVANSRATAASRADLSQSAPRPSSGTASRRATEPGRGACGVPPADGAAACAGLGTAVCVPAAKAALLRAEGLSEEDFSRAVERLRSGQTESCDDRFVQAFAIAGTAQDCLAQARWYGEAGATELALSFAGDRPEDDIRYLGDAMRLEVSSR